MKIFIDGLCNQSEYPTNGYIFILSDDSIVIQVGEQEMAISKDEFLKIAKIIE